MPQYNIKGKINAQRNKSTKIIAISKHTCIHVDPSFCYLFTFFEKFIKVSKKSQRKLSIWQTGETARWQIHNSALSDVYKPFIANKSSENARILNVENLRRNKTRISIMTQKCIIIVCYVRISLHKSIFNWRVPPVLEK